MNLGDSQANDHASTPGCDEGRVFFWSGFFSFGTAATAEGAGF